MEHVGTSCPVDYLEWKYENRMTISYFQDELGINSALKAKLFHENIMFYDCVSYHRNNRAINSK
ncbi:hypothetical protein BpHYR1_010350 [Brachionus plicatilis]|uniref:Uncharacterized protein n=1 Tax=Brachionus plicatilis TaxID=10195 RepID=A0A3M7PB80_BRAPC|nr:hypothetical protein BpHYR1_010350 [Brachionus plicatilis]